MADVASLVVKVSESGVKQTSSALDGLGKSAKVAAVGAAAVTAAAAGFSALLAAQRQADQFKASLETMTGSAKNASTAFAILGDFARKTPYGIEQAVSAFTKLTSLGLTPSIAAMTSYGNTASAMGKDLEQMVEAVADATTGEFERLKEFGIKSKTEGDKVRFTFQGVTTEVQNSASAIEGYLQSLGNNQFAGAMDRQAATLNGAINGLEDSWGQLVTAFANGKFDAAIGPINAIADGLAEVTDELNSGAFQTEVDMWVTMFDQAFGWIGDGLNALNDLFTLETGAMTKTSAESATSFAEDFASGIDSVTQLVVDTIRFMEDMAFEAETFGEKIKAALTPGESVAGAEAAANLKALAVQAERDQEDLTRQRMADVVKVAEVEAQAKRDALAKDKKQNLEDLVKNRPARDGGGSTTAGDKESKAAAKSLEKQKQDAAKFMETVQHLNDSEIEAITSKEQEKMEKLEEFRQAGLVSEQQYEDAKTEITLAADTERAELLKQQQDDRQKEQDNANTLLEQIQAANEGELAEMDRQNEAKLAKLQGYYDQGLILEEQFQAAKDAIARQGMLQSVQYTADQFGNIANNMAAALQEGSKEAKAAAVAAATVAAISSAIQAYQSAAAIPFVGWIMGPVAAAAALAAGMANVAKIKATPAREQGGQIRAGVPTLVGEKGPEMIMPTGNGSVKNQQQLGMMGGSGSGSDNVTIVNNTSASIGRVETERDQEGRLRIMISEQMAAETMDSNSRYNKSRRATSGRPGYR